MTSVEAHPARPPRPAPEEPHPRRWTREEYYRLAEEGWFQGRRVERIGGEILEMSPQLSWHSVGVALAQKVLDRAFGDQYFVRSQLPLEFIDSDPEPDAAVVSGSIRSWSAHHPTTALLVVEVSDSTLAFDRGAKASLYASAGIADYWIVNLVDRRLEVHRRPMPDAALRFGFRYDEVRILNPDQTIAPLAAPDRPVTVGDLLP